MSQFAIRPTPPFRLDLTAWALRRLPANEVDRWDGQTYRRVLVLGDAPVQVAVTQAGRPDAPLLRVAVERPFSAKRKQAVAATLEKMLGLRRDLTPFYRIAECEPKLGHLVRRFAGVRPPRFPTVFEALLNAFACQQLSLAAGLALLNRLVRRFGLRAGEWHAFPRPQELLAAEPGALRRMGFSRHKTRFILGLARRVAEGGLDLEAFETLDNAAALEQMRQLPGVGRWTAEYVLPRGLGRLDRTVFLRPQGQNPRGQKYCADQHSEPKRPDEVVSHRSFSR